jgi:isoleucyl-tRNA synthetase
VHRADGAEVSVKVTPSAHAKCERCWHYRMDVNAEGLCGRCEANLHGAGEKRVHA